MKVRVVCQSCYQPLMVSQEKVGKKIRCSQCGEVTLASTSGGGKRGAGSSSGSGNQMPLVLGIGGGVAVAIVVVALLVMNQQQVPQPIAGTTPSAPDTTQAVAVQAAPAGGSTAPVVNVSGGSSPSPAVAAIAANPPGVANSTPSEQPVAQTPPEMAAKSGGTTPAAPAPSGGQTQVADTPESATPKKSEGDQVASTDSGSTGGAASTDAKKESRKSDMGLPSSTKLDLPELIKKVEPSVVLISTTGKDGGGTGSGFVIDKDGTVVTNVHVIRGASKATVKLADGTKGEVTGIKLLLPRKDIAIVTVNLPKDKLHPLPVSSQVPDKGISTAAFGAPYGLSFTASEGIISSLRPAEDMEMAEKTEGMWLQTTTPISPGNSGGPLVDMFGSVVGMNTMQLTIGQNLNFAISCKDVYEAIEQAPEKAKALENVPELHEKPTIAQQRLAAKNEIGTERGQKLFAGITEIFPINMARFRAVILDPTGNIWNRIVQRSEAIVEKCGIDLSFVDEPSDDASVLLVHLDLKRSRKGGRDAGTQELFVRAELIVFDNEAEKRVDRLNIVWKNEMSLGTISAQALATGSFPRGASENLTKFFNTFQTAYNRAVRETNAKEKEKENGGKSDSDKSGDDKKKSDKKDDDKSDSDQPDSDKADADSADADKADDKDK